MRLWLILALFSLVPSVAAAEDFRITLNPGQAPQFSSLYAQGILLNETPGERIEYRITDSALRPRLVGTIVSNGYFSIQDDHQAVPEADGFFFTEIPGDVEQTGESARVANLSRTGSTLTLRLAIPLAATGNTTLLVRRDLEPPAFALSGPSNVTHYSFYLETTTGEYALADLRIRPAAGGDEVQNPTPDFARLQRFPIQGLDPEAAYVFYVEFRDWARNIARSPEQQITTLPRTEVEAPRVTDRFPPKDAALAEPVAEVWAAYEPVVGVIDPDAHVRLFVDKREVSTLAERGTNLIRYVPAEPLGNGRHEVNFEIYNSEGGFISDRWSFTVETDETPAPGLLALCLAAASACVLRRRRG